MKTIQIKNLMVAIESYATVTQKATLSEAVAELEKTKEECKPSQHKHRAILVLDDSGDVVGKINMFDILFALEPKYRNLELTDTLSGAGLSPAFIKSILKDNVLWNKPLQHICSQAVSLNVSDFMAPPTQDMYIDENATLDEAIHQMVMQKHESLLVQKDGKVVGVIKLADVFDEICNAIKTCKI